MALASTLLWSAVMFLVAAFAGFTSFRVRNHYQTAMIYLNAASTGVILAAAFTHLLPDAIEDLGDFTYPVGPAMSLTGFLLMVLIETGLHSRNLESDHKAAQLEHQNHDCADHDNERGADPVHSFLIGVPSSSFVKVKDKVEGITQGCGTLERQCSENAKRRQSMSRNQKHDLEIQSINEYTGISNLEKHHVDESHSLLDNQDHGHNHNHSHSHSHDNSYNRDHGHGKMINGPNLQRGDKSSTTAAASTSLWLALVAHSVMEGFGVGVTSNPLKQTTLVLAILIHKGFASLALASALLESGMSHSSFLSFFMTFALSAPAGAVLACLLSSQTSGTIVSGVITGLASGSFMYIGFMEMLPAMLTSCQHMADAMALFVAAAVAMAALAAVV